MYYYLISSLKRRLILELQDVFSRHPVYSKIVPYIQNRYSFEERPQHGIVVKGSSANKVQLSADNFIGEIQSHVMLAYVGGPAFPLEWVREDLQAVSFNGNAMPTPPGVYYIEILEAPTNPNEPGYYAIDPLLTRTAEPLFQFQSGVEREAQLQAVPVEGTLRIWENERRLLREGVEYVVDYSTGAVTLTGDFFAGATLVADYRTAAPSVGPVAFGWNQSDFTTLPGVVLAFGKRARKGDKVAVVIYPERVSTALAYGGKFEVSFDLDVISRDTNQMEELADLTVMYLWGEKRQYLAFEGIEITDVNMGGEAEEVADETGDLYFYQASLGVSIQADWEIHVPLPLTISRMETNPEDPSPGSSCDPGEDPFGLKQVASSLFYATHPVVAGRNNSFERIG